MIEKYLYQEVTQYAKEQRVLAATYPFQNNLVRRTAPISQRIDWLTAGLVVALMVIGLFNGQRHGRREHGRVV